MATNGTTMMRMFSLPDIDCFSSMMITTNGIWLGDNPFMYALPLFLIQVLLITLVTRILHYILRPLHQPLIVAEILAGFVLGPSVLGKNMIRHVNLFPGRSIHVLSSAAHLGLLFLAFMVGVELDIKLLRQMGTKITMIGLGSILLPFVVTTGAAYQFRHLFPENATNEAFFIYLGIALSITPFSVVSRVLSEFKLLNSELGHITVSASTINEMFSWVLFGIAVYFSGVSEDGKYPDLFIMPMEYIVPSLFIFVVVCVYAVRPALVWLCRKTPEGERMSDVHAGIILMGVPLAGFIADSISVHFVLGAFIYGLVVPTEPHGTGLIERMEDLVMGFLMPIYFCGSGLKLDFSTVHDSKHVVVVVCTFLLACTMKLVVTSLLALYYNMSFRESLSLGFLMSVKGFVVVIMIGIAKDKQIVNPETATVIMTLCAATTAVVVPVVAANYKPSRTRGSSKHQCRNLVLARLGPQLRILACVHNGRSVPSTIALLDLSNPTKRSPVSIYALHLVELTSRTSAMLITHNSSRADRKNSRHLARHQAQSEHIVSSFESYEQHAGGVSLQVLTSISPYSAMHEDICHVAEDKQADIIILPFHKLQTVDGNMEAPQPAIRVVNQNVLNHSPCSVAIFVDRFLGKKVGHGNQPKVAVLFFGGPDDREAVACAWRMANHPSVSLAVVRFVSGSDKEESAEAAAEQALDEQYVSEFRLRHLSCESIEYTEKVVKDGEETVAAVRSMGNVYDLYIVGRSQGMSGSKLTAGLTEWSECPELGPVGDLLATEDFGTMASVMVVQQYINDKKKPSAAAAASETEAQLLESTWRGGHQ